MKRFLIVSMVLLAGTVSLCARKVSGSVKCGKEKLAGVIVTDGTGFTLTGRNGRFTFDIADDADFVHIVTPSGYTAPYGEGSPVFYMKAYGRDRFDFRLTRTADSRDYTIVAIADPQTLHKKHFAKFERTGLPDIYSTVDTYRSAGTTVGITLGDICWDSMYMYPAYRSAMAKTGIPFYAVIGNHDHQKDMKGDHNASSAYRDTFGPENYAFRIGDDFVIVLDNIIYDTQKKYKEGYTEDVIAWVKGLLDYVPAESHILIAQHSPLYRWFSKDNYIVNGEKMLDVLKGRQVTFMSGHTHINNYYDLAPGIRECNVAAICGSWWITDHCTDGTPAGYKVFEKRDGKLSWYYKSVAHDTDFQVEIFLPGQSELHPDGVLANVWDYDPSWKVEWYEDGRYQGDMEQVLDYSPLYIKEINAAYTDRGKEIPGYKKPNPNIHYFLAEPSQSAETVTVAVTSPDGRQWKYDVDID